MDARSEASRAAPRCWFYMAAVLLMLIAVTIAFVQKRRESGVAIVGARRAAAGAQVTDEYRNSVQQIIQDAERWAILSFAAVLSAIVSSGVALRRHETLRGAWVVVIISLLGNSLAV